MHGGAKPVPFRRMEVSPGFEAQVDFGTGAPVVGSDGKRRRTHVLRVVLSHSRKGYSEAVFTQSTDDFIGCLENAFEHFGGVAHTLVIDNLKAAVIKADWFDPKLAEFCRHYGTMARSCFRPSRGHRDTWARSSVVCRMSKTTPSRDGSSRDSENSSARRGRGA